MPKYKKQVPTWAEMRQFGCGWWIRNVQHLRNVVEKVMWPLNMYVKLSVPVAALIKWWLTMLRSYMEFEPHP